MVDQDIFLECLKKKTQEVVICPYCEGFGERDCVIKAARKWQLLCEMRQRVYDSGNFPMAEMLDKIIAEIEEQTNDR